MGEIPHGPRRYSIKSVPMADTTFATVLTCIDGRIKAVERDFLLTRFGVAHLDTVTRAGIVKHLTSGYDPATNAIVDDLEASRRAHNSQQLALVAHTECAGNPVDDDMQRGQLAEAITHFGRRYPEMSIVGLWLGEDWTVEVFD